MAVGQLEKRVLGLLRERVRGHQVVGRYLSLLWVN